MLAFIPLTQSVFWGSMAYTLIGGTAVGTVLILVFLPALYAIWFGVRPGAATAGAEQLIHSYISLDASAPVTISGLAEPPSQTVEPTAAIAIPQCAAE